MRRNQTIVPLMRASEVRTLRGLIRAAREPWPFKRHRSLSEIWAEPDPVEDPDLDRPAVPETIKVRARKGKQNSCAEGKTADSMRRREGLAAESRKVQVSSGAARDADDLPANARQACVSDLTPSQAKAGDETMAGHASEAIVEPVSRPAAGRSAAATSEFMDVTAGETAPVASPSVRPAACHLPEQSSGRNLGGKIDLAAVSSAMDRRAEQAEAARVADVQAVLRAKFAGEVVLCRCGGRGPGDVGPVPSWFGRDCIEAGCPLKSGSFKQVAA